MTADSKHAWGLLNVLMHQHEQRVVKLCGCILAAVVTHCEKAQEW